jgi:hypothetical protein
MDKKYEINVDARILELLGPNLYTNIYYVLAEMIANAYDADASNVYIIFKDDSITIEDDGIGMSYESGDIRNFLFVARESRIDEETSYTKKKRYKMGRKGVGKLAALSVSGDVEVCTVTSSGEKSGFILTRKIPDSKLLEPINESRIKFEYIKRSGTSIRMIKPQYSAHKTLSIVKKNLQRIFPLANSDFKIHLFRDSQRETIESFDRDIVSQLAGIITLGDDFHYLNDLFKSDFSEFIYRLNIKKDAYIESIDLKSRATKVNQEYKLIVRGWIGVYKTTKGRKTAASDFPDNFISIFANGKMGEFNILPIIGQNKLSEVYVVGQLHSDLFEETSLPDMALSNRQGYKSDDIRYETLVNYVRNTLLREVLEIRALYSDLLKSNTNKKRFQKQHDRERDFRKSVNEFKQFLANDINTGVEDLTFEEISSKIDNQIHLLGIKPQIDASKRELLISHTGTDTILAEIIYDLAVFNNIPQDKIIYTSCENEVSRIPEGLSIFDYLRCFFVESVSDKMPFVVFVTSDKMSKSWGALLEVGAAWITKCDHKIFNIFCIDSTTSFKPSLPLDISSVYNNTNVSYSENFVSINNVNLDDFCVKIESIARKLGYNFKKREENIEFLKERVAIVK